MIAPISRLVLAAAAAMPYRAGIGPDRRQHLIEEAERSHTATAIQAQVFRQNPNSQHSALMSVCKWSHRCW